jgi:mannitol-1-phosphate 5-dehydrogenase
VTLQPSQIAVQFGAGNIGRGFIGVLLRQAGYSIIFVDVVDSLVEQLNQRQAYTVIETSEHSERVIMVENIRAINGKAEADVIEQISRTALITTAVGPGVLPVIAPVMAKGLRRRAELGVENPLNIIACENLIDNSKILQGHILNHLPAKFHPYVEQWVGFPCCVVDKVVTIPTEQEKAIDPLIVVAEAGGRLIVDRYRFVGKLPAIEGVQFTENLDAYVEQKIFTLNTAHALIAYLGYLKGYEFIQPALADPEIRQTVLGALAECSAVLVKRHQLEPATQQQYANSVLQRFENSTLPDPIARVAREPKRKLAPNDRLVKPAMLALEMGLTPNYLAEGIAAALLYNHPDEAETQALQQALREQGIDKVLLNICQLAPDHALTHLIKDKLRNLRVKNH